MTLDVIHKADCLTSMAGIPDGSVDMLLCDMPYNCLECEWDKPVDLKAFWKEAYRIAKQNATYDTKTSRAI